MKGYSRSLICDLQKSASYLITNRLYEYLTGNEKYENLEVFELDILHSLTVDTVLDTVPGNVPDMFPEYPLDFDFPAIISNAILEVGETQYLEYSDLIAQLEQLGCPFLEIRYYRSGYLHDIQTIATLTQESTIECLDFYLPPDSSVPPELLLNKKRENGRIRRFFIYSTDVVEDSSNLPFIVYITQDISKSHSCGFVHPMYFSTNRLLFTESVHHNSCLNRKISIDVDGNIKNCPSMSQSFGNIKDTTLQEALDHPDFKKYWNVTKDQIAVCKDCEFRYICTDCRAYIENPEDMYSKPLKCGYNPYTGEWEEWSTNPLKQKAIDYYGMREVLPEFKMKPDYVPNTPSDAT